MGLDKTDTGHTISHSNNSLTWFMMTKVVTSNNNHNHGHDWVVTTEMLVVMEELQRQNETLQDNACNLQQQQMQHMIDDQEDLVDSQTLSVEIWDSPYTFKSHI